jgi:hypothetical protein
MVVILCLGLWVGGILRLRLDILSLPDAYELVRADDTQMEKWVWIMYYVAREQLPFYSHFLLTSWTIALWLILYVLAGFSGGITAIWLRMAGIRPEDDAGAKTEKVLARFFLSGVAGALTLALLYSPAPLIAGFFGSEMADVAGGNRRTSVLAGFLGLAILAGLFSGVFFKRLFHWFKKILPEGQPPSVGPTALILLGLCTSVLLLPVLARAQTVSAQELDVGLVYWECVEPDTTPRCVCAREEDKGEACPTCVTWEERRIGGMYELTLDSTAYAYSTGIKIPRANYFARDVAFEVFNVSFPETEYGFPIRMGDLYHVHDSVGWVQVVSEQDLTGTLAVWESGTGLVVRDSAGVTQVIYPSHKREGLLTIGQLRFIADQDAVKFLVPGQWLLSSDTGRIRR